MTRLPSAQMKRLAAWMNAAVDAWNMGEARLFNDAGGNHVVACFGTALIQAHGDLEAAVNVVVMFAQSRGIDPRRHRLHRP